jgi:hypothetical protein
MPVKHPYRATMHAILRDGEPYMILPTLDEAETHLGLWSKNGFSKYHWTIQRVSVTFPHETATEKRKRLGRHVQSVVEMNRAIYQSQ